MFALSYVIILAFHPDIELNRTFIAISFGHNLQKLADASYLLRNMLSCADSTIMKQLGGCAIKVSQGRDKQAITEMFTTEMKLAADCVIRWLEKDQKVTLGA